MAEAGTLNSEKNKNYQKPSNGRFFISNTKILKRVSFLGFMRNGKGEYVAFIWFLSPTALMLCV
jgi:hypothetical protein